MTVDWQTDSMARRFSLQEKSRRILIQKRCPTGLSLSVPESQSFNASEFCFKVKRLILASDLLIFLEMKATIFFVSVLLCLLVPAHGASISNDVYTSPKVMS